MRHEPTPMEARLWSVLRNRQLDGLKFRRQVPLGHYIVDFYCADVRLIIEVDGGGHIDQESHDAVRSEWLESKGYHVIRFTNDEVSNQIDSVIEVIRDAILKK